METWVTSHRLSKPKRSAASRGAASRAGCALSGACRLRQRQTDGGGVSPDRSIRAAKAVPILSAVTACHRQLDGIAGRSPTSAALPTVEQFAVCIRSNNAIASFHYCCADSNERERVRPTAVCHRMRYRPQGGATESTHWPLTVWSLQSNGRATRKPRCT